MLEAFSEFCDVDKRSNVKHEKGCLVIRIQFQYQEGATGLDIENQRTEYLRGIVANYVDIKHMEAFTQEDVLLSIDVAEHNKTEFNLYLHEYEKQLIAQTRNIVNFNGDVCLSVVIDMGYLAAKNETVVECTRIKKCVEDFVKGFVDETLENFCEYEILTGVHEGSCYYDIFLTDPRKVQESVFCTNIKEFLATIRVELAEITLAAYAELDVKGNYKQMFASTFVENCTSQ